MERNIIIDEKKCGQCGEPLPAAAPEGLCPACLLKRGFETQTAGGGLGAGFIPPTPEELARYFPQLEILQLLGRGGMGVVYKARQRELDRLVALKVLPAGTDRDPAFAERFGREARALARLSHTNIVAVYDYGQTSGLAYFVMEYIDGLNLRQVQAAAKMTTEEALAIVPQICDALQTAHDQGIVHRDIKPENILIDKKGRVKIADFGISKIMGSPEQNLTLTGVGEVIGTPIYMAPEQIEHPQEVDHRADIYSLGVVFYQMLTGELPLGKFAPPSRKVRLDVRLDDVVLRALEKEPELRYQQANEVKTRVETISGDPSGSERRVSPAMTTRQRGTTGQEKVIGYLALYLSFLSGLIPTIFYWFKPWAAPWLTPEAQQMMLWATLWVAIAAMLLGIASRRSRHGRSAIFAASISLTIWLLFFVAGKISESHARGAESSPPPVHRGSAFTGKLLAQYPWTAATTATNAQERLVDVDGREAIRIENLTDHPLHLTLLKIDKPPVTAMTYALAGEIKYQDVKGPGYLEMWNFFPPSAPGMPEGAYFSRTLGDPGSGLMERIEGTSDWRGFSLPFDSTGSAAAPTRLEMNIFLPGQGVVYIGPVELSQLGAARVTVSGSVKQVTPVETGTISSPPPAESGAASDDAFKKRGTDFVQLLMAGKFEEARGCFADVMLAALPEPTLAKVWHQLDAHGKFLGVDPAHATMEAGYSCIYVPCRWEHNNVDIKVVFDTAGKISGLWVVPYAK